ncbi:MAG: Ig-like domain-containing protein, partial [Verrucomicrobiota bacterium]
MNLAWDPSPDVDVQGYRLYYGSASGNYSSSISVGNVMTAMIPGLLDGVTYFFVATAYNTAGLESDPSNEVSYSPPSTTVTNRPPTLNALNNLTINESAGLQSVGLSGISSGAANEFQTLTVTAGSSNPSLIANPAINYSSPNGTGILTFTPVAYAFGTATITVTVNDGQFQNNLITRSFVVTVNAVNQAPTLNALNNVTILENASAQTVTLSGISSGAANETQTLAVTAASSNPSLIPNPIVNYTSPGAVGSVTFTPALNASGSAIITVTVNDGQTQNNLVTRTFTVSVSAVNQSPTLNVLNNRSINENAGAQTVNLSGITSGAANELQTLSVTAVSSNPGIIPNPTINYTSPNATGSLTFTPLAFAYGSSTITVTVNDGGASNNVITRAFTVTVNSVNQAPTLDALSNLALAENAGAQTVNLTGISSGAANEAQTLSVTAVSSNPGLIPNPAITYASPSASGSLTFTPVAFASGIATVSVTINDGGASNNLVTRSFSVTVNAVNQAPTLNALGNLSVNQNSGSQIVNLSGISSGAANESQTLSVTAVSSSPGIIPNPTINYTSPNATGLLTFTPLATASGLVTLTVTVNDGVASNNVVTRSFTVTVNAVNQAPTLNALNNFSIIESAGLQTVNLSGISPGAANEAQTLSVTASSSNPSLIPNPTVAYTSPNAVGSLSFIPIAYAFGTATITVTVNDGQILNNTMTRSFTVTVNPVNQPPTLNALNNLTLNGTPGTKTVNLAGISSGQSNEIQTLTAAAVSSNPGLIPNPTVSYTSPNSTGSLTFTPVANAFGTATISVTVNDGQSQSNTVTRSFTVSVNAGNQSPVLSVIPDQITAQDTSTEAIPFSVNDRETSPANLTFGASSSNPDLVAKANIIFGGSGIERTITVTPLPGKTGTADITISVSDGSLTSTNSFRLSVVPEVILVANGNGSIEPNVPSLRITPGASYSFSATPQEGNDFAGWSGSISSRFPSLTLTITSNITLIANFIPSPFVASKSSYNGLFYEDDQVLQESAGYFSVALTDKGAYSGRLQMGTTRYSIRGRLDDRGRATNVITRLNHLPLNVELRVGSGNQVNRLFGRVSDGSLTSTNSF